MMPMVRDARLSLLRAFGASILMFGVAACAGAPESPPPSTYVAPPFDAATAALVRRADSIFTNAFPNEAPRLTEAALPRQGEALIGRNREWGRMYAARFQMGTGSALRVALAAGRAAEARRAFEGVEAGFSTIEANGRLPASVPLSFSLGAAPSETDVASGAAFFLGDACLGLLALEASPIAGEVASSERRERARARAARAITWLVDAAPLLAAGDAGAPNRLLFDARVPRLRSIGVRQRRRGTGALLHRDRGREPLPRRMVR